MEKIIGQPECVICDIDGTVADISHRQHYVMNRPKNWKMFNHTMHLDQPNYDIIWLIKMMQAAGVTVLMASGRSEDQREVTEIWLREVATITYTKLYMRPSKDNRSDDIIKAEILEQMWHDGYIPTMAIDDRNKVCDMWRANGLRCLQVAPGNF